MSTPPSGNPPTSRGTSTWLVRLHHLLRRPWGVIASLIVGLGIVTAILADWPAAMATLQSFLPASPSSSAAAIASVSGSPAPQTTPIDDSPGPVADGCLSAAGASTPCDTPDSGLAVDGDCEVGAVMSRWGVSSYDQLGLVASEVGGRCAVFPAEWARADGANGASVQLVSQGRIPAGLRECVRADGTSTVACDSVHEYEWVSAWTTGILAPDRNTWCTDLAVGYTSNSLSGSSPLRSFVFLRSDDASRCAVGVSGRSLLGSVRDLGTAAPPVQ